MVVSQPAQQPTDRFCIALGNFIFATVLQAVCKIQCGAMKAETPAGINPPRPKSVALVVVAYRPEQSFAVNMEALRGQFSRVILVDNTEADRPAPSFLTDSTFDFIRNDKNIGLGEALNVGCCRALELGYEWAVTLDQDTELLPGFLGGMVDAWNVAVPAPMLLGSNYFNVARSGTRFTPSIAPLVSDQKTVITSGGLTHLPTWKSVGMFRGDYFIDAIDHEFCLRLRQAGYRVAVNRQLGMRQHIGEDTGYASFMTHFLPYRHSTLRKYTGARNATRTLLDYAAREPLWASKKALGLCAELLAIVLFEPNKWARLQAFSLGVLHGFRGKLGAVPQRIRRL